MEAISPPVKLEVHAGLEFVMLSRTFLYGFPKYGIYLARKLDSLNVTGLCDLHYTFKERISNPIGLRN
jgi:hypothetical protein